MKGLFLPVVVYSHVSPCKGRQKTKVFSNLQRLRACHVKIVNWNNRWPENNLQCGFFSLLLHENNSIPLLTQKHRKKRHFSSRIVGKDQKEKSTYCAIQLYTLNWTQTCYQGWMISVSSRIHAIEIDVYVLFLGLVEAIASQFLSCLPPYYFEVGFQRCARIQFF